MIGDNNLSYEKSPFTKVFLFLRNRELSMKGFLLDGTSLLYLSLAMGMENDDDRENVPIEEGEKILQGRRIKLRCPPKVLTGTLHPSLPSIFSG